MLRLYITVNSKRTISINGEEIFRAFQKNLNIEFKKNKKI